MTQIEQTERSMINETHERAFLFTSDDYTILCEQEDCESKHNIYPQREMKFLSEGNIITHSNSSVRLDSVRSFTSQDIDYFF